MKAIRCIGVTVLLCIAATAQVVQADVKLPAIIGDNMVLQRGIEIPIWGTADPGEKVTVTLAPKSDFSPYWANAVRRYEALLGVKFSDGSQAQLAAATAGKDGRWIVRLKPIAKSGAVDVSVSGKNTIELKNVLVGEVWVCSGQSNMEWSVRRARDAEKEIAAAKFPSIRLFKAKKTVSGTPLTDTEGAWVECSPATVADFTAVGYFFGRALHQKPMKSIRCLVRSAAAR